MNKNMKQVNIVCLLNIVKIKDRDPRFNIIVVLENKSTSENVTFVNFSNIEFTPTNP